MIRRCLLYLPAVVASAAAEACRPERRRGWLAFLGWLVLWLPSSRAGIILDGVPDASYLAFASQFPASGRLLGGPGPGSGTLIAPHWVLSAGHVFNATTFQLGGSGPSYSVAQVVYHPQFLLNGGDLAYGFDLALYRLSSPVLGVTPASIYRSSSEVGATAAITGFGLTGVGVNPSLVGPAVHRAGTNQIDNLLSFADGLGGQVGAIQGAFIADFDAPAGIGTPGQYNSLLPFGSLANPTGLEYHLANGDSGGGVYLYEDNQWYLAGINSAVISQSGVNDWLLNAPSGNTNRFGYGAASLFTRVSSFQAFIDANLSATPEPSSAIFTGLSLGWILAIRRRRLPLPLA